MIRFFHDFAIGAGGAAAFEALKVWELRGKLKPAKFKRLVTSAICFWIPLILMLSASGFLAWAFYDAQEQPKAWSLVITGVTCRTLMREVAQGVAAHQPPKLGESASLRDFFA